MRCSAPAFLVLAASIAGLTACTADPDPGAVITVPYSIGIGPRSYTFVDLNVDSGFAHLALPSEAKIACESATEAPIGTYDLVVELERLPDGSVKLACTAADGSRLVVALSPAGLLSCPESARSHYLSLTSLSCMSAEDRDFFHEVLVATSGADL